MKMRPLFFRVALIIMATMLCASVAAEPRASDSPDTAKNTILLIGDGMGAAMIGLAKDYARVVEGRDLWIEKAISKGSLALVQVPALGTLVTDSAASGTAIATGARTRNKTISVDRSGKPLTTILELAEQESRSTGLVTTTRLTHATPACFAAHVKNRSYENKIARQMLASGVDVLLGGGLRYWIAEDADVSDIASYPVKSKRSNGEDLVGAAMEKGYLFVTNKKQLAAAPETGKLLGIFADSHMPYALDQHPDDNSPAPSLVEMTEAALKILAKNEKGFFLMVEGGRIDHAAHANDAAAMLAEMMEFDETVGLALDFAEKNERTAVIITADHVTGGPCLSARYSNEAKKTVYPTEANLRKIAEQDASFEHILTMLSENPTPDHLEKLVSKHTGVKLSTEDTAFILKGEPVSPFHVVKPKYARFGYPALAMGRVLGLEYGIAWATGEHFSEPVLLIGCGARADLVRGYLENTDIYTIMKTGGGF